MKIYYLGNEFLDEDNLVIQLIPKLKEKFPKLEFIKIDTFEKLTTFEDGQVFLDVCKGIDKVTLIEDINQFSQMKRTTAHDVDFAFFLQLQHKMKPLDVKVICVPMQEYGGLLEEIFDIFHDL